MAFDKRFKHAYCKGKEDGMHVMNTQQLLNTRKEIIKGPTKTNGFDCFMF